MEALDSLIKWCCKDCCSVKLENSAMVCKVDNNVVETNDQEADTGNDKSKLATERTGSKQ